MTVHDSGTVAGTSSSVLPVNFGEQLANGLPFRSDEPHHKQIMSDKDLSSNKGIDSHTAGSELVQLGALVHLPVSYTHLTLPTILLV